MMVSVRKTELRKNFTFNFLAAKSGEDRHVFREEDYFILDNVDHFVEIIVPEHRGVATFVQVVRVDRVSYAFSNVFSFQWQ